jgi:uncharacterized protein YciI
MYIVNLTYLKPVDAIESHLEAHYRFLDEQYTREIFLASGPKNPRDGGLIIASGRISRAELDTILRQDPFYQYDLAAIDVIEFSPLKSHPALKGIL